MDFIVNMMRDSAESGGRDRFSCSSSQWELLLELGKAFGWKPKGTTYVPAQGANSTGSAARHDYRPGSHRDYKQIETDDAAGWAAALNEARRSPHLPAMVTGRSGDATPGDDAPGADAATLEQVRNTHALFAATLDEFIEYAFGGAFSFAGAG